MIRWYLKYSIRRAIEQQVELQRWVQRKTDGDRELSQYAKNYARMIQQLSAGADDWMQAQTREEHTRWNEKVASLLQSLGDSIQHPARQSKFSPAAMRQPSFRNSTSLRWGVCFAAILLLTSGLLVWRERSARTLARKEATQTAEMTVMATRAVLEKGHWVADQSVVAYERTRDKVSRNLIERLGDSTMVPIEASGRWLGVAIKELHSGAIREQKGLVEMSKRFRSRFEE